MKSPARQRFILALLTLFLATGSSAQELIARPGNGTGVYKPGDAISWQIELKGNAAITEARYTIKKGGLTEIAKGAVQFSDGKATLAAKLDEPGSLLAEFTATDGNKRLRCLGGALVSPEQIKPAAPRPDDFDAFWDAKLKELAAVPANPVLEPADGKKPGVDYWKISMDNIRGSKIRGQLARPKQGDKLPALLIVQWAGVYPLQKSWATDRAAEGWLVLNINAHDLPIDEPADFYTQQNNGPLKNYPSIGNDDREKSYFLRMYLSCYRGAQYLAERPDWDGKTLVVTGGSQGGLQTILTAAIHPKITAALASVPAGCDLNGPSAGRIPGWPMWCYAVQGKDRDKVIETSRYYDMVNFAPRVKCPILIGVGLIDTTCPAPGVFAACNQFQGQKEIVVLPLGEHGDKNGSHQPYNARWGAWLKSLREGQGAPVR
jgi:cephalosporin-C deacetylase